MSLWITPLAKRVYETSAPGATIAAAANSVSATGTVPAVAR